MITEFRKKNGNDYCQAEEKKHTHSQAKYCKIQNKKMAGQKRTLNSGRPSEKQHLRECHIFTNLALAKE